MINLKGHTALITGSTLGVGRAIAFAFAEAGANLVLHGLEDDLHAQEAIDHCRSCGVDVHFFPKDLSADVESATQALFESATGAEAGVDILVNNAGTYMDAPFLDMPFEVFDRTMKLNVYSYFLLAQHFARYWVEREVAGRILCIGSINGKLAEPDHTAYDTSKGAVEMMVKSLCVSLAPRGIRVNGLAPGLFYTPLTAPALDDPAVMAWMKRHTPNGEVPGPEVCGEAAVYLVSDAARHVHGHMMMVDGGMSVWQQPDPV